MVVPSIFTSPAALTTTPAVVVVLSKTPLPPVDLPTMLMFWVAFIAIPTFDARLMPSPVADPAPALIVTAPVVLSVL